MAVQVTIRNVREDVRARLAARAAMKRQSMQQYLSAELERIASEPSHEALLERARRRLEASGRSISANSILETLDADKQYDRR